MKKGQQVVDIELIDKPPRRAGKSGSGLKIDTPRPVIARAVLGSQSPEHFEDWYYDTIDSLFGSSFCIDQPIEHVGIGKMCEIYPVTTKICIFFFFLCPGNFTMHCLTL